MLWVDNTSYFGPDRRCKRAMRQLRMRVLDAQGAQAAPFVERLHGVAHLARMHNEPGTSNALNALATTLAGARGADIRQRLYDGLDRANAALRG